MRTSWLIISALLLNAAVFIAFPDSGRMGITFFIFSSLLWCVAAVAGTLLSRVVPQDWKAFTLVFFSLACAFCSLSFFPQKDGVSPLDKLLDGRYPGKLDFYKGLMRVGIDYPALIPPKREEPLP